MKFIRINILFFLTLLLFSFLGDLSGKTNDSSIAEMELMSHEGNTELPLFPGCDKAPEMEKKECSQEKLLEYVKQNLNYPEELKVSKIEGSVFVRFVVGINGFITKGWIDKSLHPAADNAALKVVDAMNEKAGKWTPGRKNGVIVSMEMVLPVAFSLGEGSGDKIYTIVSEMPRFPGCEQMPEGKRRMCANEALQKYIYDNVKYPARDRQNGTQGIAMAEFVIQPDGTISDAKIVRGISAAIDFEVLRVINTMNDLPERWMPGFHEGIAVPVRFTLPVKFLLGQQKSE